MNTANVSSCRSEIGNFSCTLCPRRKQSNEQSSISEIQIPAPKTDPAALKSINPFTKNKATEEQVASTKKQKAYYKKYATEIEAYKAAQQHFETTMNGRTKLSIANRQKEQKEISSKRYALCDEFYSQKDEIPNMEAIRRSIEGLMKGELMREQPQKIKGAEL